jgi:hypothetical protein
MSDVVEALLVAAARELVWTRSMLLWYGKGVFLAAAEVAFADKEQ